ncbi:MAG TPA: Lsr2 family protein [Mycobacteriales bacterium]|nr:Lsr2 family protein [Mycobacteriales bacterium]
MAQKVQVLLVDDLDGGEATETVSFALDGTSYEIDLSGKNAEELRDAFAKYVGAARKAGRSGGSSPGRAASSGRSRSSTAMDRDQAAAIRSWAKKQGLKVSDRGRIPASIIEQYNQSA